jgi:HAE1 family hydrophobic/amphiphilic exporter-1
MNISAPFIHRPIATGLLMVTIVLLGFIGYELLPVAALPSVDSPTIQVTAQLPGADPRTVASSVATPLERQFGQIPGLMQMTSSSALGYTQITLQFGRDRTVDSAAQDVQAAINATAGELPPNLLNPPIYRKTNPADTPILLIALTSETLPLTKVSDYANSILAQKLSQMPGVGLVTVGGAQNPSIRVQIDPAQLAAQSLDLETVRTSLANSTVNQLKGTLYGGQHAFSLLTNDQMMTAEGFNEYILAYRNGAPIRVGDVGQAVVAAEDKTLAGWSGTQRAVLIQIQRQPGANVIETVDGIKKELPQLQASLPPSIKVDIVSDRTQTIRASVADVQFTLFAYDRTGGRRNLPLPAKTLGDHHPGHRGSAVAHRHLRDHVCVRLQPGQSFIDGAHHCDRLCGR